MSADERLVLVYGGAGALGSACVTFFGGKGYHVVNVDIVENETAYKNVLVSKANNVTWSEQDGSIQEEMREIMGTTRKFEAIICPAGGWAGGNVADKETVHNSELVWRQSVWSSTIAATLAAKYLRPKGVLVLFGAAAAYDGPTPGMIGYGMAKAAVIQLTRSLGVKQCGLPEDAFACCLMPETLDTPSNRIYMPKSDFSKWTPLEEIAKQIDAWMENPQDRPKNGALLKVLTRESVTRFEEVA